MITDSHATAHYGDERNAFKDIYTVVFLAQNVF